jgi:hypothetical protein
MARPSTSPFREVVASLRQVSLQAMHPAMQIVHDSVAAGNALTVEKSAHPVHKEPSRT